MECQLLNQDSYRLMVLEWYINCLNSTSLVKYGISDDQLLNVEDLELGAINSQPTVVEREGRQIGHLISKANCYFKADMGPVSMWRVSPLMTRLIHTPAMLST